jgi:hypothetical protein
MDTGFLLKHGFNGLKWLAPFVVKFLSQKKKELLLKQMRTKQNRLTVLLMSKKAGKSQLCEYLNEYKSNELNNTLYFDLDGSVLLNSYNYKQLLASLDNDTTNILLFPEILKIVNELKTNFKHKNIVLITSNEELAIYMTHDNEYELLTLLMTNKLFNYIVHNTEADKKEDVYNSYISLSKLKVYKYYESFEELKTICKNLFIN